MIHSLTNKQWNADCIRRRFNHGRLPSGTFVAKITNDDREGEMEENMEQVSAMVGNLRNMANDMGQEVERQNVQLDRINLKAGSDITRVKMANDQAAALMK